MTLHVIGIYNNKNTDCVYGRNVINIDTWLLTNVVYYDHITPNVPLGLLQNFELPIFLNQCFNLEDTDKIFVIGTDNVFL